jgi:hypothetical protein
MGTVNVGVYNSLDSLDAGTQPTGDNSPPLDSTQQQSDTGNPPPSSFQSQTQPPAITLNPSGAPAFSTPVLYVTLDDSLMLTVWNSNAALTSLQFNVRFMRPDGTVGISAFVLNNLTADRTANTAIAGQLEGFILGAVVVPPAVAVVNGECFITLSFVRGTPTSPLMVQQLVGDYVSSGFQPGWPTTGVHSAVDGAGKVYGVASPVPAAGANAQITQPARTRWVLLAAAVHLATSAAAGSRKLSLVISFGAGPDIVLPAPATQAPSTGVDYTFAPGIASDGSDPLHQLIALPSEVELAFGSTLHTSLAGIQAGDQFTALSAAIQEWIDV